MLEPLLKKFAAGALVVKNLATNKGSLPVSKFLLIRTIDSTKMPRMVLFVKATLESLLLS